MKKGWLDRKQIVLQNDSILASQYSLRGQIYACKDASTIRSTSNETDSMYFRGHYSLMVASCRFLNENRINELPSGLFDNLTSLIAL